MASPFAAQILPSRAVIRLAGEAPLEFLHNLLTCQLAGMPERTWAYGALLSPQGKIQHDVFVIHEGGTVFVDCAASQVAGLMQKLKLYRLRARIEITPDESLAVSVGSEEGLAATDPRVATMGLRAITGAQSLPAGEGHDEARIVNGLADSDSDIGENQLFPHEANFDFLHGVSFSKGCYIGQEVVSRMQHRGTARSRILPVRAEQSLPAKGTGIRSGETLVGEMLSSRGPLGLALVRLDRLAEASAPLLTDAVRLTVQKPAWMPLSITSADS